MENEKEVKPITWAELKEAANKLPEELLCSPVILWGEEWGCAIKEIEVLEEDYHFDGEFSAPRSTFEEDDFDEKENYLVAKKGEIRLVTDYQNT